MRVFILDGSGEPIKHFMLYFGRHRQTCTKTLCFLLLIFYLESELTKSSHNNRSVLTFKLAAK